MKTYQPTGLGRSIVGFFQEYLPTLRGMSRHTIQSYRDGLVLFLQFAATDCGRAIESLEVADITADRVGHFLAFLETARRNSITTRNARLAALHTFARFLVAGNPDHMAALQQVLGIPVQEELARLLSEYLEKAEIEVLLAGIDRSTLSGQRDYAMFSLMFNTGARVQEILNLRVRDVRLESPFQVRLAGKGNKMRICPIWPRTAQLLKDLIQKQHAGAESPADQSIFLNERGAAMTRFGVRYLLQDGCSRHQRSPDIGRQTDPSAFSAPHHSDPFAHGGRRLCHHQPVARSRKPQHDDAICACRHRSEATSVGAGFSRGAGTSERQRRFAFHGDGVIGWLHRL